MSSREAPGESGRAEKNRPSLLTRRWRVGLFTGLYLYQGTVAGFATLALANHLAGNGHGAGAVGSLLALIGLPWVLQPLLWGPLLDRAAPHPMGAHRVWLVCGLLGGQVALCLPLVGARADPMALGGALLLHSLCASLADTATDRMIVANVPEDELGRISACTRAGFVTGSAAGAALFGWLLPEIGIPGAAALLLALTTALAVAACLVRERPGDALLRLRPRPRSALRTIGSEAPRALAAHGRGVVRVLAAFRHREAALLLTLCFGIDFALSLFQVPFAVAMVRDHGWEAGALSQVQALLAFLGGTLGAGLVGFAVDRAGPALTLRRLCLACAAAFALIALLIAGGFEARGGPVILGLASVVPALLYVALQPAVVLASRAEGVSATQFQIFMAAMNLGDVAGASLAGAVERWASPAATACGVALVFVLASLRGR